MSTTRRLLEHAGVLIDTIGTVEFPRRLRDAIVLLAPTDSFAVLFYHERQTPVVLYEDLRPEERGVFYEVYQKGIYLLGPFYQACMDSTRPRFCRISEIAPDDFFRSRFRQAYYAPAGLFDEAGYVIPLGTDGAISVSMGRINIGRQFADGEITRLKNFLPVVAALVRRQWPPGTKPEGAQVALPEYVRTAFDSFGTSLFTKRERDVAFLMLRGHSSKSAARLLDISPETERVHRRNIYEKLGVSSQAALCSLFFESLAVGAEHPEVDPLARVLERRGQSEQPIKVV